MAWIIIPLSAFFIIGGSQKKNKTLQIIGIILFLLGLGLSIWGV
jgi:hypothetical protein